MDSSLLRKTRNKIKRAGRTRLKIRGTHDKPRLCVLKSNAHIHVQLIDDENHITLVGVSTIGKEVRDTEFNKKSKTSAKHLGLKMAELATQKNIKTVVFDRGPYKYHGVIAAVADGAREGGLEL